MSVTMYFIAIVILAVVVFDVWVIWKKGKQESISAYIIRGSYKYPLVTLIVGILIGHLYWSMPTENIYKNTKCFVEKDGQLVELKR